MANTEGESGDVFTGTKSASYSEGNAWHYASGNRDKATLAT
jgi:hypothetical protein